MATTSTELYRTAAGGKRHVRNCPHVKQKDVLVADESDGAICSWCAAELAGKGRIYFDTVEDALPAFGAAASDRARILELVAEIDPEDIWIPASGPYIALSRDGKVAVWIHKSKVEWTDGRIVELPGFRPGNGGGSPDVKAYGETCEKHFITRALTGRCERCDD